MTLIEVMLEYQRLLRAYNRISADSWLQSHYIVPPICWDISHSFDEKGNFVDGCNQIIHLTTPPTA